MFHDGLNPEACEIRHLSCRERTALKTSSIARAQEERNRLLRVSVATATAWLRRCLHEIFVVAQAAVRRQLARQQRFAELRQLAAMSDRELRDMGITRTEIRAVAQSGARWPRYGLHHCPTAQTTQGEKHAESLLDCPRLGS
jgi:uncharacterized protein YjiS (DUF1127 family)